MQAGDWDARYAGQPLVWPAGANRWVQEVVAGLTPGRALDVAAGEGRNAFWLVEQGWRVHATDFSPVAVERMGTLADERLGERRPRLTTAVADAVQDDPGAAAYGLVLLSYLQLPGPQLRRALAHAVDALEPDGTLLVVGHALQNLAAGTGGPQDPAVLYDPHDVLAALAGLPVVIDLATVRRRKVAGAHRPALDTLVVGTRLEERGPPSGRRGRAAGSSARAPG